jgi:hypothetical protein
VFIFISPILITWTSHQWVQNSDILCFCKCYLQGCNTISVESQSEFQRSVSPLLSGSQNKAIKKPVASRAACYLLHACFCW